ncbi:MAG TPA: nucleotide exchange factor GrpE [Frankiaceae bacterium]|jgi:molecular chaperone GrpE|nr:nucleotide exchange factor GrpE [Frankiaceae bacterium]
MTEEEVQRVVVRDKRRVDPEGHVREPDPEAPAAAEPVAEAAAEVPEAAGEATSTRSPDDVAADDFVELRALQALLDERTADLQRLKAEFDNYRKRVERERAAMAEQAVGGVLLHLLPVLDDVDRAREHGEVTGGFKSVADALESTLTRLGLERFGAGGDPFDPMLHEAVTHGHADDVTEPTCVSVMRPGYRFAERLLRPAMVAVAEPAAEPEPAVE